MQEDKPQPQGDERISLDDLDSAPNAIHADAEQPLEIQRATMLERVRVAGDENDQLRLEVHDLKQKLKTKDILDGLIEPYAGKAYRFMCAYSGVVALMLFAHGADFWYFEKFSLPSGVLEFLVGSTAATVIGLVGMVLTGVFVGARKH